MGCKELDTTEQLNWAELNFHPCYHIHSGAARSSSISQIPPRSASRWSRARLLSRTILAKEMRGLVQSVPSYNKLMRFLSVASWEVKPPCETADLMASPTSTEIIPSALWVQCEPEWSCCRWKSHSPCSPYTMCSFKVNFISAFIVCSLAGKAQGQSSVMWWFGCLQRTGCRSECPSHSC